MTARRSVHVRGGRLAVAALGALLAVAVAPGREAGAGVNVFTGHGPGGGDVWSLAALQGSPTRVLAATASGSGAPVGAIWASSDAGAVWHQTFDLGQFGYVYAFAQDPGDPSVVYAATRWGVVRSRDRGEHWVSLSQVETGALAIAPSRPTTIYAVANGALLRSDDGAVTWRSIGSHLPEGTAPTTVAVSPGSESTVVVGTQGSGVLKSTDGGASWAGASAGLPATAQDRVTRLTFDFHTPAGLLAVVESPANAVALFRSADGGAAWTEILLPEAADSIASLELSRKDPALIDLLTPKAVLRSRDDGAHWSTLAIQAPVNAWMRALAVDPNDTEVLYAGGAREARVLKSVDGGSTWAPSATGIAGSSVQALALGSGTTLEALVQTLLNDAELFGSEDRGASWSSLGEIPLCAFPETMVVHPSDPDVLYVGGATGPLESTDGGRSWVSRKEGLDSVVHWIHALAIDPSDPSTLYAGSERLHDWGMWWGQLVYRSTDGGATWQVVSSGMPTLPTMTYIKVTALAVDPRRPSTVWAGGSLLWRTTDAGRHWASLSTPGGSAYVSTILVDPRSSDRVLCAQGGAVLQTADGGSSWRTSSPPGGAEAMVLDPTNPETVWAGGYGGVSVSRDGGATWTLVDAGLPAAPVTALAIEAMGRVLHAATDGLGVFDLELSSATPELALVPGALTVLAGSSAVVTAILDPPQLTDTELLASSSSPEVASFPEVVTLPAGEPSVALPVTAGTKAGNTAITVRLPASLGGAAATAGVTVAPPPGFPRRRLVKASP